MSANVTFLDAQQVKIDTDSLGVGYSNLAMSIEAEGCPFTVCMVQVVLLHSAFMCVFFVDFWFLP